MTIEKVKALFAQSGEPDLAGGGILADSFRGMLFVVLAGDAVKDELAKWDELMDNFVRQELALVAEPQEGLYDTMRTNLTKELTSASMSWKTYLNGLRFLGLTSVRFVTMGHIGEIALDPIVRDITWTGPKKAPEAPEAPQAPAAEGQSE